jgi:hypothetical protein
MNRGMTAPAHHYMKPLRIHLEVALPAKRRYMSAASLGRRRCDVPHGHPGEPPRARARCVRGWGIMDEHGLIRHILRDENLTRGLWDPEARLLVEWLAGQIERLFQAGLTDEQIERTFAQLYQWGRAFRRFVLLWCHQDDQGAAAQLAAAEGFSNSLPPADLTDPCDVMAHQLRWVAKQMNLQPIRMAA